MIGTIFFCSGYCVDRILRSRCDFVNLEKHNKKLLTNGSTIRYSVVVDAQYCIGTPQECGQ
jgi:hypothetical protein